MKHAYGSQKTSGTSTSKSTAAKPAPTPSPAPIETAELTSLQSSLTGGSALPASTRKRLEGGFQTDLSDVRVHTGGAAATATNRLQADAFASGSNIAFASGKYAPGSKSGDHLIAEEVAHVIQQRGSGGQVVQRHATVSSATDSAEIAARSAADNVVAGKAANLSLTGLSTRGRIMRRARMSAAKPSPVVADPTNGLGTTKAGPAPVLTPVMTSTLSPAGGKLVDSAGRKDVKPGASDKPGTAKTPDEAQTSQQAGPSSAPSVMTAGSPVGASAEGADSAPKADNKTTQNKEEKREKDKKDNQEKNKKNKGKDGETAAAATGGGGGTFGKVKGDRGAGAAGAAKRRLQDRAEALGTNEGADNRIGAARAAAAPPANAAEASGQQSQATTLENADVPAGDPETARSASRNAVAAATPGSIEDLEDFASPGGASQRQPLTDAISGQAAAQTDPVQASLSAVDTPPLGTPPSPAVPQPAPMVAPGSADPAITQATPPPVNEEALDATEFKEEANAKLSEHDVDDETLAKADEGPLREIGNDKTQLNDKVTQAAGRARATETQARDVARGALAGAQSGAQAGMDAQRTSGQTSVSAEQDGTRTGEEQSEQTLADQINTTYQTAQTEVNGKLGTLTQDSVETFRERQGTRLESFASGVRSDLADLKRRRYSGVRGAARRVRDWLLSINSVPEVKQLYQRHRDQYISDIDALITQIKADIDRTIEECKTALRTARETIEQLVADNAESMDQDAQAALTNATAGFQRMEQQIDAAAEAAKRALDAERERAIQAMDAELERIRSENAGLVDRLAAAVAALAAALGQFMMLMTRVTRMGIGTFLSAALSQAGDGVRNNLWGELQEAFKQWLFMKLPVLQLLLSLPPNWYDMLTALATNMIGMFTENLPAMLPAIGTAAMIWLATTLAAKLIPGVGAIMAVIDGIRGAYALVQSLFQAASAFFEFVMKVAERGNGAVAFARALAFGIVAAVDAVLTFLGVDRLIQRVIGAIARPFGRIIRRVSGRFRAFMSRRRRRRSRRRQRDRRASGGRGGSGANRRRGARSRARNRRRNRRRRRSQQRRRRDQHGQNRPRRESASERRRRRQRERERRNRERLRRAVTAVRPRITSLLRRGVTGLRLRAQLAMWRIRYRIRKLAIEGRGRNARVVAANSPDVTVRQVLLANTDGVYRMVHDIGMRRFRAAASGGSATPGVQPGDRPSRLGAETRQRDANQVTENPNRPGRLHRGTTVPLQVGGTTVPAAQGGGRILRGGNLNENAIGNVVIPGLGTYPDITSALAAQGHSGPGITRAVTEALRTGTGSPQTMRLVALIFGAEVGRRPIVAATGPLTLSALQNTPQGRIFGDGSPVSGDLFGASDLDPSRRVRGQQRPIGGGISPFTAEGAAAAGRRTDASVVDGGTFRQGTSIGRRSRADLLRTVELVYQAVRHMSFSDMDGLRREIEQLFRQFDRAAGVGQ
ncbi:eCIS core domain-containing protein [Shimia sp.]|uniref:eCIS core domain-containing protein n=1 Tax=Shimia sp. TaxID=1954381 RepID=UPI003B8DC476